MLLPINACTYLYLLIICNENLNLCGVSLFTGTGRLFIKDSGSRLSFSEFSGSLPTDINWVLD